ncbi:crotonase/enoyl-CoA hydratase family protein [Aureimonas jatrophae]|uniref:Methylglutaconyl-CoA hydratase n=1 Tax=Aureimonas jatrophae TaxID=1166073 RepID=A0A1H0C4C1_9HYPH|nr:crotonase/enoyl-CoA hydratase family protein [Aureimonas jatrophae]MBB3949061.1 methylglutaconyl-CoA hydratase [Aureimonas jatrophae]SDN52718.1 methylglutaconyl-CoA hydratase [Aureimonas jatrophae]
MSYRTLRVERDARGVVTVALNRPAKRNALSVAMIDDLTSFAAEANRDGSLRAMVLRGEGEVFCAGGDLEWMRSQVEADRETRRREARRLAAMLRALNELRAPLIGAIHGAALGGGAGLAAVCDVALAVDGTRFGFTETRLGLIPATIGPYVIARLGEGRARQVFMSSRVFDADEAVRLGLVARCVERAALEAAVEREVAPYLQAAPGAVARAKALALDLGSPVDDAAIDRSVEALVDAWDSEEARVGIAAFLDKRSPPWASGTRKP